MFRRLFREHRLSAVCYLAWLGLCLTFLRWHSQDHGLYDQDGQLNAVPVERAFYNLVAVIAAAALLLLIALTKALLEKKEKKYYLFYTGLIILTLLLLWAYLVI